MATHPSHILPRIKIPCGATAVFDHDSGISYRCEYCFAVVGSIGQPQHCKDEAKKYDMMKALGGKGWVQEDNIVEDDYDYDNLL